MRLLLTLLLALTAVARAEDRVDALGDPLPAGARERWGTGRLQQGTGVLSLAWTDDGQVVASTGGALRLWEARTGRSVGRVARPSQAAGLVVGLRGRIACAWLRVRREVESTLALYDAASGRELAARPLPGAPVALCRSRDGALLAVAMDGVPPLVVDAATLEVRGQPSAAAGATDIALSPDGRALLVGAEDGSVSLVALGVEGERRLCPPTGAAVAELAVSPDGERLAIRYRRGASVCVRLSAPEDAVELPPRRSDLVFAGRDLLAIERSRRGLSFLDPATGAERRALADALAEVIAPSPDGARIAVGRGLEQDVRILDARSGADLVPLPRTVGSIDAIAVDARRAWYAGNASGLVTRDLAGGAKPPPPQRSGSIDWLVVSTGGERFVAGPLEGSIINASTGRTLPLGLSEEELGMTAAAFSADGQRLAAILSDGSLALWRTSDGERVWTRRRTVDDSHGAIAFLPGDAQLLATGKDVLAVHDAASGELVRALPLDGWMWPPSTLHVSPDGARALGAGSSSSFLRIDLRTGEHEELTLGAAPQAWTVSSDLRLAVVAFDDGVIRGIDALTGEERWRLPGDGETVSALALSPDGATVYSGQRTGTVLVWDVPR